MFFEPVVYEHAAALLGKSPWDVSRDAFLILNAHLEAYSRYKHSPVVIGIDIYNLEPEAYGATVERPDGNGIPAISRPALGSLNDILSLPHFDPTGMTGQGRVRDVINAAAEFKTLLPDIDVRVPVSGPFSIAGNLVGFENLLIESITDPGLLTSALDHLVHGQIQFAEEIHKRNLGISLFESGASPPMVSPGLFRTAILPPLARLVSGIANLTGQGVPCIMGGDTTPILDLILETGTSYVICSAETDQREFMEIIRDRTDVTVRVNMTPAIIANGEWDAIRYEVDRILDLIDGRENACIGTGPLPYETNPDTVLRIRSYLEQRNLI